MKMPTNDHAAMMLALSCFVAAGCSAQAKASANASAAPGGSATASVDIGDDSDSANDAALADLSNRTAPQELGPDREVFSYPYAFDYDNDGSYAASAVLPVDEAQPERPTKYAYAFDRDDDGSYARERVAVADDDTSDQLREMAPPAIVTVEPVPLDLDPKLAELCEQAKPAFYFEYDSSKLPPQIDEDLDNLVDCLQHPVVDDRDIEVVGHADERGTAAYNYDLGLERARAVASELTDHGLDDERIEIRSMGEVKADDPEFWDDRRVVIRFQ